MADEANAPEEAPVSFNVKSSSDAKFTLSLPPSTTVLDLKTKLSTSEYADISVDRQRLIYSGRVLKDADTLGSYKIKDGHTVHLVKGAASNQRQTPATQGSTASTGAAAQGAQGVPANLATGTGNNPLAGLTGARYAGFAQLPGAGMFGPDGGMGPPPDPEQMSSMMRNPQFASSINEALQNPQLVDMMIQQNPMLRNMGPQARQIIQSPEFRRMLTDPDTISRMTQMQQQMGGGMGRGGQPAFPAPGVTDTTPGAGGEGAATGGGDTATPGQTNTTGSAPPLVNPFALFGDPSATGGAANPFAALLGNPPAAGQNPPAAPGAGTTAPGAQDSQNLASNPFASLFAPSMAGAAGANPQGQNPFGANNPGLNPDMIQHAQQQAEQIMRNPEALQQMMQLMGGAGANPFAMFGGGGGMGAGTGDGSPAPPADTRPPEERYETQLRQLNDMGFYEFERNVEALRRTGGSVQGAVEYLLTH
ncbi:MAG: hypothetical protein M1835_006677 [Candelina submexicana]|nr:MAG: hypothetical protein M1835_006677 [Candelina submexicana]